MPSCVSVHAITPRPFPLKEIAGSCSLLGLPSLTENTSPSVTIEAPHGRHETPSENAKATTRVLRDFIAGGWHLEWRQWDYDILKQPRPAVKGTRNAVPPGDGGSTTPRRVDRLPP